MTSNTASPNVILVLLFQAVATANVENYYGEEKYRGSDENDVKHEFVSFNYWAFLFAQELSL